MLSAAYLIDCGTPVPCRISLLYFTAPLAFTTIPGSGGAPDSFVGTAGIDAIAFAASRASFFLGAQGDNDVVAWVGTDHMDITVTNATIRGGGGNDLFTAIEADFASVVINGNAGDDVFSGDVLIFLAAHSTAAKATIIFFLMMSALRSSTVIRAAIIYILARMEI